MAEYDVESSPSLVRRKFFNTELVPISGEDALGFLKGYFPEDYFEKYEVPKENLQKLVKELTVVTGNIFGSVPVLCKGPACAMKHACPFDKQGLAPIGFSCPLEQMFLQRTMMEYVSSEKLNIASKEEMEKARELAECDLYIKFRTPAILSKDPTSFQELSKRYHPGTGQLIEEKNEIAKALEVRMKMSKRRDEILEELVLTRRQKFKHKVLKPGDDPSKANEELLKTLGGIKIEDAEYEVVDEKKE